MRKLSTPFMRALRDGFLTGIVNLVQEDKDLDLHIRENFLNVYYKGNSMLRLAERRSSRYKVDIHPKFLQGIEIPDLVDEDTTTAFLSKVPSGSTPRNAFPTTCVLCDLCYNRGNTSSENQKIGSCGLQGSPHQGWGFEEAGTNRPKGWQRRAWNPIPRGTARAVARQWPRGPRAA